ncbi:hypothetical protein RJ640_002449 [Escallonia rubra]|uniref:Myb/SANT-like domain-containing protein n=1 Tax=Escallonia rubra TaxID=112253 RepID=A0AA88UTI6_9ASTE|nr:hypothetical protein RJ640_002449 [Escallonia rubra]
MDRLILEIPVDEATKGNKPSSPFKPTSFVRVAQAINQKFGCEFSPLHVENHLRTVKKRWSTISLLRCRSGYGWDANLNMIVCDKQQHDEEVTTSRKPDTLLPFFDATAIALHGYDLRTSSISLMYKRPSPTPRNNPSEKSFLMLGSAAAMLPPESTDSRYQQCSSRFPQPGMESLTSPGSFVAIANDVRAVALRVKKLQGNQNFLRRKPWMASVAIKRVQISDTAAMVGGAERIADGKPVYKFNFVWQYWGTHLPIKHAI